MHYHFKKRKKRQLMLKENHIKSSLNNIYIYIYRSCLPCCRKRNRTVTSQCQPSTAQTTEHKQQPTTFERNTKLKHSTRKKKQNFLLFFLTIFNISIWLIVVKFYHYLCYKNSPTKANLKNFQSPFLLSDFLCFSGRETKKNQNLYRGEF